MQNIEQVGEWSRWRWCSDTCVIRRTALTDRQEHCSSTTLSFFLELSGCPAAVPGLLQRQGWYSRPMTNAERLREFHRAIGQHSPTQPTVPDAGLLQLRRTLIAEEWREVEEEFVALQTRLETETQLLPTDLTPLVHELTDLLYVTYGALDQLGVDADAVFAEVHRANLSKASGPKRSDGKQLKPEGWRPADVRGVLEKQL